MRPSPDCVPLAECKPGRLYKIRCRNLLMGVFNGKEGSQAGFIGIREKFNSKYLFTEYHHETGAPFGTVFGVIDTGVDIPEGMLLAEHLPGSWDSKTGREVEFDKPVAEGGKGWYFKDTGEPDQSIRGCIYENGEMFNWLMVKEAEFGVDGRATVQERVDSVPVRSSEDPEKQEKNEATTRRAIAREIACAEAWAKHDIVRQIVSDLRAQSSFADVADHIESRYLPKFK